MSTQPPSADHAETPPAPKERGGQVNLATLLARLDNIEKAAAELGRSAGAALAEMRAQLDAVTRHFLALQAVVRAALPAQLLRLTPEHLAELAQKAPQTKIRLLSPLQGPNLLLREGTILPVSDRRIAVYHSIVQASLVIEAEDDVAVRVRQIIDDEIAEVAAAAAARDKQAAEAQAAALQAQAAALRGELKE